MSVLAGVRIAVTRPAAQSDELANPLADAGATVHVCPLIRIEPIVDAALLDRVMAELRGYSWLVLTSVNGADQFADMLRQRGVDASTLKGIRVACVGPATAAAATKLGLTVHVMPEHFTGAHLPAAMAREGTLAGRRVLIARAAGGSPELAAGLRELGAEVDDLELYRSVPDPDGADRLERLIARGEIDLLTFTSGSAITYFVDKIGNPPNMLVAVIGPSTAQVARSFGLRVDIEANPHTIAGMIQSITDYYAAARGKSEV